MFDVTFVESPVRGIFDLGYIDVDPLKGLRQMTEQASKIKVKVRSPFRVIHEGKPHTDGDVLTVPEKVAAEWEAQNLVERVASKEKA